MKKIFLLATSALLLLAGCAKEAFTGPEGEGGLQQVTFTASMAGDATKAAVDGDGAADYVNRCIMEIYYDGSLFERKYAEVTGTTTKTATFSTQLVAGRTYTVAFWADCVADASTSDGLATDRFYTTNADGGLQAIALAGTYAGNSDERDAFFHCGDYTIAQGGSAFGGSGSEIYLRRPFAQMNVITTDADVVRKVTTLKPTFVNVNIKNAFTGFNALTGDVSTTSDLTYSAAVYNSDFEKRPSSDEKSVTLSMDYLFAATDKAVIDIDWKAGTGDFTVSDASFVSHSFSNIPYQRNYRTNIKGALLTTTGQWNVTVDPIWEEDENGEFDVAYTTVCDIAGANDFVANNTEKKEISVTFSSQPNDAGVPTETGKNAIVTSLLAENATYNIDVASSNEVLYVGDYDYDTSGSTTTYDYETILPGTSEKTNSASVNLVVTNTQYIGTLVVNSPSKSVSINGQTLASGKTYHIENLTVEEVSMNTVIIESGMTVTNMTMKKGGLEIHGTVTNVTIPENHGTILVRDCENLSQAVYDKLAPYIDTGYASQQGRTTSGLWDIYPAPYMIGETYYGTLAAAVEAVTTNAETTISMVADDLMKSANGPEIGNGKNIIIDLNGHKLTANMQNTAACAVVNIANGGALKMKDSGNGGSIIFNSSIVGSWPTPNVATNVFTNQGTLVIEGGYYENLGQGYCAYVVDCNSNTGNVSLTVTGGHQVAQYCPIRTFLNNSSTTNTVNISGGTFEGRYIAYFQQPGAAKSSPLTCTISGGTFIDKTTYSDAVHMFYFDVLNDAKMDFQITGGLFSTSNEAKYFVYPDVASGVTPNCNIKVAGGKYSNSNIVSAPAEYASGFGAVANTDLSTAAKYPWSVEAVPVCKIGSEYYYSLAAAIDDVPTDGAETQITMLQNVAGSSTFTIPATKNIVLELNGKMIYASSEAASTFALFENKGIFTVQDNTDTQKNGTGTGKLTTVAYNPDMQGVPGYASNTIMNYGKVILKSGLIESASEGSASFAIDHSAQNIQWHGPTYSSGEKVELYIQGGKVISGASQSIRMYLRTDGNTDNIVSITGGVIDRFWVQDDINATAAKGTLTMDGATILRDCLIGYQDYTEHFAVSIKNSTFGGKLHYELDPTKEGNTLEISNITAHPYYMDTPAKVLSDGTYTIKGELSLGWVYAADADEKAAKEAQGIRMESDPNYSTWYHGYLTEVGQKNNITSCLKDGYELVCTDETAGTHIVQAAQ